MRAPKKEMDCHTKAIIDALRRWDNGGRGRNIFITGRREDMHRHMDAARLFLAGKYPVLSAYAMQEVTLGNGTNGNGLGFYIRYICAHQFQNGGSQMLGGTEAYITILDDAMLAHTLTHGEHQEVMQRINIVNSRYEV